MHNYPTSTTKDTIIIVYFIPINKTIAEYKVCGTEAYSPTPSLSTIQIIFLV